MVTYEWARPQIQPGGMAGFPGAHLILPTPLRFGVRRAVGTGPFEDLPGSIVHTLIPMVNPPPGHAEIAVRVDISLNLRQLEPWDGKTERRSRRWMAGEEPPR